VKNNYFFTKHFSNIYEKSFQSSKVSSQILYGEEFKILSKNKNWLKIKTLFDNYVGYIKKQSYVEKFNPTHKIFKLKSKIFIRSKIKKLNESKNYLPFASKISIIKENKKFIEYEKNRWIKKSDIKTIDHIEKNYLKILKLFLNIKYVWGGKTYKGIDCSAILQLFFYYNGKFYPRDTKYQIKYLKKNKKNKKFKKGDIIFWKGHVAVCIDSKKLIHAYGPKKKVLIMPINYTIKKIDKTANLTVKKLSNILN
jgi:cell wall-associated NlpC family hydrolase